MASVSTAASSGAVAKGYVKHRSERLLHGPAERLSTQKACVPDGNARFLSFFNMSAFNMSAATSISNRP